ncbi:MAG: hypothetical protein AAGB22_12980, partial [Bacteroidota bacterium]
EQEFLPFRVHQFISQTQVISVTLETPEKRAISSSQLPHIYRGNQRMPLFPVVFNQQSGFPYLCVYRTEDKLIPRSPHLNREPDAEQAEKQVEGYLLVSEHSDEDLWNPVMERNLLPDTWLDAKKNYQEARSDKKKSLPEALYVSTDGVFTQQPRPNSLKAWFIRSPLHLDPISGTIYPGQSRDFNKLMQVGNPGRTITTTLLTYATLQQLDEVNAPKSLRKFMSFTDNRQDAALQTGHFNDFMQQCFLRASIYRALEQQETLDIATIGSAVFGQMGLTEAEFARPEVCNTTKFQHDENLRAFKAWLFYRIVHDLRRGWRHRMPNLEQCALIEVRYKGLWEECQHNANWKHSALLRKLGAEDRYEFLTQFLNYFRSSFALYHKNLEKSRLEEAAGLMQQRLSNSWLYQDDRKIKEPNWLRVQAFRSKKYYTES